MVLLNILPKGNKWLVTDSKERVIYTIKKNVSGGKFTLIDASGYKLYYVTFNKKEKKPVFKFFLNDNNIFDLKCTSIFLEPSFEGKGNMGEFKITSADRRDFNLFDVTRNRDMGEILVCETEKGNLPYEIRMDEKYFDDFVPLFAVCIDQVYGELNKAQ